MRRSLTYYLLLVGGASALALQLEGESSGSKGKKRVRFADRGEDGKEAAQPAKKPRGPHNRVVAASASALDEPLASRAGCKFFWEQLAV